jgi:hypothetical protein
LLDGFLLPAEKRVAHCYHHTLAQIGIDISGTPPLYIGKIGNQWIHMANMLGKITDSIKIVFFFFK